MMNRNLLGNLKIKTSSIFVENSCRKLGRGLFGLFLVVLFTVMIPIGMRAQNLPTISTESSRPFYRINVAKSDGNHQSNFNVSPTSPKVSAKSASTNEEIWYFVDAFAALPVTIRNLNMGCYCYIVNAKSGEYLYYIGGPTSGSSNSKYFVMKDKDEAGAEADRFKFGIVKSGNTSFTNYVIYPKIIGDNNPSLLNSFGEKIWLRGTNSGNAANLSIDKGNDLKSQFNFVSVTDPTYGAPSIANDNGTISISVAGNPTDAKIYYTTDGTTPSNNNGTLYSNSFSLGYDTFVIKAVSYKYIDGNHYFASAASIYNVPRCATPEITNNTRSITITCATEGATIYYTTDGTDPIVGSASTYGGPFTPSSTAIIKALAVKDGYCKSFISARKLDVTLEGEGTTASPYIIASDSDFANFAAYFASNPSDAGKVYRITANIDASGVGPIENTFTGTLEGLAFSSGDHKGEYPTISGLTHPLFNTVTGGTVCNVMLKEVAISQDGDVGAICCTANGDTRIYSCGILPTDPVHFSNNPSTVASSNGHNCGSLVGLLDGTARVINCFSYAWITKGGGGEYYVGGLVGNNSQTSTQTDIKTIVVNCMFYGDIDTDQCRNYFPVYGNQVIKTESPTHDTIGINPYDFFRESASFDNRYLTGNSTVDIVKYNRSWPVLEDYLTRYEYYRSIFNSNRRLCTWWVNGTNGTAPTDEDVTTLDLAKWVLDPSIAPFPILKKWGKYPCITNPDPDKVWDTATGTWMQRANAAPYQGRSLGTLSVTVFPGTHAASSVPTSKTITLTITDMDTLHFDYGYYKVQLPYYNELFGDPSSNNHDTRYGGNYKDYVVTGWKITSLTTMDGYNDTVCFEGPWNNNGSRIRYRKKAKAWESGFNYADRKCTSKDLYVTSGRVFAQGGYYYVPEGVTSIEIEAYWGKAVYLHNTGHYLDRVDITNYDPSDYPRAGAPFEPSGTLPTTFQGQNVKQSWKEAVLALDQATLSNDALDISVYDQAIVLLNNLQWRNENDAVGTRIAGGNTEKYFPYTIMSIDKDLDNEPDYCFELQFRRLWPRPGIQPIRFDFLPVPELGMAVRHGVNQNTIGIFVPLGHFEITETSYMHTTQFEYDAGKLNDPQGNGRAGTKVPAPVILNGGHFEQIVVRYGPQNNTQYFIMGGHFRMLRFTPGAHTNRQTSAKIRLCAVNVIGGEFPEFYLSGIYRPDITPSSIAKQGNPHCYINGGKFDLICGAGYDKILGSVYFKIDHAVIGEFYGGGINGSNPIGGSIDVTINNSLVEKYCGGPKVGTMTDGETVITRATGTIFGRYYGGGNGGTSYYREQKEDGNISFTNPSDLTYWNSHGYKVFNPLNTISGVTPHYEDTTEKRGYHALFEFECFVESNGLGENPTIRSYLHWAQFGTTKTGDVTNILTDCTVKKDFYGGGNLGNVNGNVTSTLTDCTILGNAFGGGYSGKIEPFRIHNKNAAHFPYIDGAGLMQDGLNRLNSLDYIDREYTWCYKNASGEMFPQGVVIPDDADTLTNLKATFEYPIGSNKWYVLTTESLEHLGAVSGDVTLTFNGRNTVGTLENGMLKAGTGNVYGGGNESTVDGNTLVKVFDRARVLGNIYGGGNMGFVGRNTKVIINGKYTGPGTGTGTNSGGN